MRCPFAKVPRVKPCAQATTLVAAAATRKRPRPQPPRPFTSTIYDNACGRRLRRRASPPQRPFLCRLGRGTGRDLKHRGRICGHNGACHVRRLAQPSTATSTAIPLGQGLNRALPCAVKWLLQYLFSLSGGPLCKRGACCRESWRHYHHTTKQ